jgi:hypothetical protein
VGGCAPAEFRRSNTAELHLQPRRNRRKHQARAIKGTETKVSTMAMTALESARMKLDSHKFEHGCYGRTCKIATELYQQLLTIARDQR